jgi:transposase-like protein
MRTYIKDRGNLDVFVPRCRFAGDTIDFMLSPKRDLTAAKLFLRLALCSVSGRRPRVINVDGHSAYARAIVQFEAVGGSRRFHCEVRVAVW